MNLLTVPNRKRPHSDEPDFDQSLPKRINQLHIRQPYNGSSSHGSNNNHIQWVDHPDQVTAQEHVPGTVPATFAPGFHVPFGADALDPASFDPQTFSGRLVPAHDPRTAAPYDRQTNECFDHPNGSRYEPELSQTENPHYYTANESLYYLHMECLRRHKNV